MCDFAACLQISPLFLQNWDPILADDFQDKWWVNDMEHTGINTSRQDLWPEHASPFNSRKLQKINEREELLKMLEDRMLELEELDNEINHCWGRVMEIQELLGFRETASQP
ncbi:hypothetical protein PAXRUDRAFT_179662 [Paxillus rubicundulus Ve08.2h10]|uniref:Uncharacterized protein n=1 Tax=Paxillus rubicundulus Ve08.2h10 TaxID=930991 RepID=A0A0D0CBQ6_9AGAM|nr:hypothetical protein PAXRUDRAFT_179662 [Paxillus rubicundulus Ve08.2h10]